MESVIQLSIAMVNTPSSLAKVGDRLRAADVNISAIACTEGTPETVIHLIVDDPETAKIVLKDLGPVVTTNVLAFKMKNKPGAIASIGRECAAAHINIRNIYATTCGKEAMVYVWVEDVDAAMKALKAWRKE
ncbi:ACT domain-containing protein [Candidatus Peregrinibacteria bacterium]|nr:ACT domain-containing protein [Candidatus Peregrinibacteria bacterium]MBI3816721.1 ACT domain-containing protein [Candidatus Peregrinibacteria bacterium]